MFAPLALIQLALPLLRRSSGIVALGVLGRRGRGATRAGAATDRRRPRSTSCTGCSPSKFPNWRSTPSIPVTCGPTCTRPPFPAKTSRIGHCPRRWCRRCAGCSIPGSRVVATARAIGRNGVHLTQRRRTFRLRAAALARGVRAARGARVRPRRGAHARGAPVRSGSLVSSSFSCLPALLDPGDVVVVNTSGTIPAALDADAEDGTALVVHLSTELDETRWVVEPRRIVGRRNERWREAAPRRLRLRGGAAMTLDEPFGDRGRLWVASLELGQPTLAWLETHGSADPLRLRRADLADRGVPERLRDRAGQRRDAERRPPLHDRDDHAPRRARRRRGAARAAHRRRFARGRRGPLPRAGEGSFDDGRARQPGPTQRPPRDRGRHDGRTGARDGPRRRRTRARP